TATTYHITLSLHDALPILVTPDFYGKFDVLRSTLKKHGAIVEMAESSSPMTAVWSNSGGFDWAGKDPALQTDFATIWVTHEFGRSEEHTSELQSREKLVCR